MKIVINFLLRKNRLLNTERSKGVLFVFDYYLNSILAKLNKGYSMEAYKHYKSSKKRLAEFISTQLLPPNPVGLILV